MNRFRDHRTAWLAVAAAFLGVLVVSLPLILNPGYFSHDELQWAARADVAPGAPLPWLPWSGIGDFQYRPLTFNLWLWLSQHLFDQPRAFHAVIVAWGAANAALLVRLGMGFGMSWRAAVLGALAFAAGPYAAYVHGWVATIGDLVCLSVTLIVGLSVQHARQPWLAGAMALALTAIGLLGKEAAMSIPPLLAVAWWFDGRKRGWLAATIGASIAVVAYLLLRWDVLLNSPREGVQYAVSAWNAPMRWLEYQLYPLIPSVLETFNTLSRGWHGRTIAAAVVWAVLLVALWRARPRHAAVFLLAGIAALGAVLPLARSWNQYGYLFAAVTAMVVAATWRHAPRWGRGVIALAALLNIVHGLAVMGVVHKVGTLQSVFSPALAEAVARSPRDTPLRLAVSPDDRYWWVYQRLTHDIPRYRGIAIGQRVIIAGEGEPADHVVQPDGSLQRVR